MKDFLNTTDSMDFEALIVLFHENKWWTIQQLSDSIGCSMETAYNVINRINRFAKLYEQTYFIESKSRKGIFLHIEPNFSISHVYALYHFQSIRFKILDHIFQATDLTIEKLSQELFVSKSTIYRELKILIEMLAATNLSFDFTSLEVIGSETIIRHFMLNFYFPVYNYISWPFTSVSQELMEQRKQTFFPELFASFDPVTSLKVSYQLAINFIRHQKGKYIEVFPIIDSIDPIRQTLVRPAKDVYSLTIPAKHQQQELNYIASFGVVTSYCSQDLNKMTAINLFYQETNTLASSLCENFIEQFNQIYPDIVNFDVVPLRFDLLNLISYATNYPKLKLNPTNIKNLILHVQKNSPFLIKNLKIIFKQIYQLPELSHSLMNIDDLIIESYFILEKFIEIKKMEMPIKIKVACSHERFDHILKNILANQTHFNLIIDTRHSNNLTDVTYDLLISDIDLLEEEKNQGHYNFTWSFPTSQRSWHAIETLLETILTNKKNEEM